LVSGSVTIFAKTSPESEIAAHTGSVAVPFYDNISSISVNLVFENGRGSLTGMVLAYSGTTSITANAVLERQNANGTFTPVCTWSNLTANGSFFLWDATYFVSRNHTYRLTLTATVVRNGRSETVSISKTAYAN